MYDQSNRELGHIVSLRPMGHLSEVDRHRHRKAYWSSYKSCADEWSPKAELKGVSCSPSSPIRYRVEIIVEIISETLLMSLGYRIYLIRVSRNTRLSAVSLFTRSEEKLRTDCRTHVCSICMEHSSLPSPWVLDLCTFHTGIR